MNIAMNKKTVGISAVIIFMLAITAAVASYTTREALQPKPDMDVPKVETTQAAPPQHHKKPQQMAASQPAKPRCDDNNIVGTAGGGIAGGVLGSTLGRGGGKTATTIAGALGGAYLGNKYIPTRDVTCQ